MADFCKQCSIEIFCEDFKNLAEITKPEDAVKDMYVYVICEGCGPIQVDPDGACVTEGCKGVNGKGSHKPMEASDGISAESG